MSRFGRKRRRATTARAGEQKRSGGESNDPTAGTPSVVPEVIEQRVETREGRQFTVSVLPEATPPKGRSKRTRYKMRDVGKEGTK